MGNCIRGANEETDSSDQPRTRRSSNRSTVGKNQPLKKEKLKWKSEHPITEGQLRAKREEFWDTAPAFEGRKEIWDALRAATYASETTDHELAQAILDGAYVTLPNGTLTDCYDELGNRYQLPLYVLAPPNNLIPDPSSDSAEDNLELGNVDDPQGTSAAAMAAQTGIEITLRMRLSTGRDLKVTARTTDTVTRVKKIVETDTGFPAAEQRWFCYGQLLPDKMRMEDCKVPKGFVIQVIVHNPDDQNPPPVEA